MKTLAAMIILPLLSGCVMVYAPDATRAGLLFHDQTADMMTIEQDVPIEPRIANELTGIAGIRGDVGAHNSIGSHNTAKLK